MSNGNHGRIRVKMCGTMSMEDAQVAVTLGVDALGFIFAPKSPRCIGTEAAAEIIANLPLFVDRVGVFVNVSIEEIADHARAGLSYLQLHGSESPEFCREIQKELKNCKLLKAFRVGPESNAKEFGEYNDCVDGFLLDTYVKGVSGGTGQIFDWSLIPKLHLQKPFLLAGGLSPDNVEEAIQTVSPFGIDINSGVESAPGVKDHGKLERLIKLVRQA